MLGVFGGIGRLSKTREIRTRYSTMRSRFDPPELISNLIKIREARFAFFERSLFADPSWDILLYLAKMRLKGKSTTVGHACAATNVSYSTASRYLRGLQSKGYVSIERSDADRRSWTVTMTDKGFSKMMDFVEVASVWT